MTAQMNHRSDDNNTLISWDDPKSVAAEAYRILRTNLQFTLPGETLDSIIITSAGPGEGKSTVSANLAVSLAQTGQKVIVVNADLRRPTLHKHFDLGDRVGLTSVLVGQATLEDALQTTKVPGVQVLTAGPMPPNPAELLGSDRMQALIDELETMCDLVIVDAPPVLAVADAGLVSRFVDGCLLVVNVGLTQREAAVSAKEQLDKVGARILGTVVNRVNQGGGYAYYYYYYSGDEAASNGFLAPVRDFFRNIVSPR